MNNKINEKQRGKGKKKTVKVDIEKRRNMFIGNRKTKNSKI